MKKLLFLQGYNVLRFGGMTVFLLFIFTSAMAQNECVLKKDKDGIQVFSCDSEQLSLKTIKSNFFVDASISKLVGFIMDIENYEHWQFKTVEAHVLKKISDHELIYYTKNAAPWPVSDRDMVIDLKVTMDSVAGVVTIIADNLPDYIPVREGLVRVPLSKAKWTIVPEGSSRLKIDYTLLIDPGGAVPIWMVNMISTQAPYESFRDLKENIKTWKENK